MPQVVTWRRHLHMHPEVAFEEVRTSQTIFDVLSAVEGLSVSRPTRTSVVAELRGGLTGPTIAVRADIDALPIVEENDVPYRSTVDGAMHACGHDGHTAIVLALATLLARHRAALHGTVRFVFQHAEELSPGGAEELVQHGVMDGVHQVIGLHLWSPLAVGRIGLISGPAMAAPDTFQCTIMGRGGHAAAPHETIDPIAIGAQVVTALQQVVSRTVDPLDPVVLSVTQFIAGTAFNVIPGSAYLSGTVRTFDATLRASIPAQMERVIAGITSAFGATYEFRYELGYRPVVNDPALTARLSAVVEETFGVDTLVDMRPSMGGEDFSAYQQRAPGVFAFVGARNEAEGIMYPHHHPRFQIDEASLAIGLRYLTAASLDLLTKP
ncbi:N-acyl-L-amino acid amidohydrolase [Gemmatimonas aurantiaca T-27]|uniref:N-acyl-L-amino acid amidohydrolase n=2 Tax=Gemmatimonas aurantiaca TaxID=173480 RepID=C1A4X3_GEMAT|nr:N-acyl-L-amino acid amidohydrolase [Gemmatimonas aurantiaca T-27]